MTGKNQQEAVRAYIECVFLTSFLSDFSFLADILCYSGVRMHRAESPDEADFLLTVTASTAFLSDVTFPEGTWRDALRMIAEVHPLIASAIIAEPVEHEFLSDAYAGGACGVLWKPVDLGSAVRTIRSLDQATRDRAALATQAIPAGFVRSC
jgi:DNA-binding NtrC family response regulator